jgi:DNA-directed RNA polymerase subunit RPC12/RpoP
MTKLENYKCERCGNEFNIPEYEFPDRIVLDYATTKKAKENEIITSRDLCSNCMATFSYMWQNVKKFDDLAEVISIAENGE